MKLFFNESGQLDYDTIGDTDTLADLLQAVDLFIDRHPLSCSRCENSCCRKPWAVEVDNVSVRRLCADHKIPQSELISSMLETDENKHLDFDQYIMKKQSAHCPWLSEMNRCRIYQSRPLICRLYSCFPKSQRFNQLREASAATFLLALVFEQLIDQQQPSERQLEYYQKNPALNALDYKVGLQKILDYALDEGWL